MSSVEYPPLEKEHGSSFGTKRVTVNEFVETICSESAPFLLDTATPP